MRCSIRNFLGVSALDLELDGVTLLAGQNASGKSSVLEAIAIGTGVVAPEKARGISTKKCASAIIYDGTQAAAITLATEHGQRRIDYPECAVSSDGATPPLGSRTSLGIDHFSGLSSKDRAAALSQVFGLDPTEEDFVQAILSDNLPLQLGDAEIGRLWQRIEQSGWDPVAKRVRDDGARLKGQWEHVTGERYGETKAATWCPKESDPAETYDPDKLIDDARAKASALEAALALAGATSAERARLQAIADTVLIRRDKLNEVEKQEEAYENETQRLRDELGQAEQDLRTRSPLVCPHCRKPIRLSFTANSEPVLTASSITPEIDPATTSAAVVRLKSNLAKRSFSDKARAAKAALREAETARDALVAMPKKAAASSAPSVDTARAASLTAQRLLAAAQSKAEATRIAWDIAQNAAVLAILGPAGLRAECVKRGVGLLNEEIAAQVNVAGWPAMNCNDDLDFVFNGRPLAQCSESELWRFDRVMQCAIAVAEGAGLVLVDRLDVLAPQDRGAAIKLLAALGVPAVIACTAKDIGSVPDLANAGIGNTVWLTDDKRAATRERAA